MKLKLITLSLAAIAFAGCSETELFDSHASMEGMIDYSLYTKRNTNTRAVTLDNTNFAKFKIYSYQNIEQSSTPGAFDFSAYYDETVEKNTTWAGPRPRRWPAGENDFLNFYAYSDEVNTSAYAAATAVDAHPSFSYKVPTTVADQQDLLVTAAFNQTEKTSQGKLNLDFKHALTQIAFKVKAASPSFTVKVSKVELVGANSSAKFSYDGTTDVVGAWSDAGTPADYAFTVATPTEMDNTEFVSLVAAPTEGNLMMIPNDDPKAVTLRVTYTLNDDDPVAKPESVLVKEIQLEKESATAGPNQPATTPVTPWKMGKKVTYNLTLPGRANEILFGDVTMVEDWDDAEEEEQVEAKDIFGVSFVGVDGLGANKAGFPLEINDNRGTAGTFSLTSDAAWVKFSETENDYDNAQATLENVAAATRAIDMSKVKKIFVYVDDNTTGEERKATITMTRADYSTVTIDVIQSAAEVLLSGANCYIIGDANVYTLDATKKGNGQVVDLPSGYDADANPATAIPASASDVNITNATTAEVLWETTNVQAAPAAGAVVKDVKLSDDGKTVFFTTTATEGNAVIVVKNGSTVLWSWHIWRTNATIGAKTLKPIVAANGTTFADGSTTISTLKVMDRNLGALSATAQDPLSAGLVYQWGRPVPFPGSYNLTSGNTVFMGTVGTTPTTSAGSASLTPSEAEAHPEFYYTGASANNYDWCGRNDNLWGTPLTTTVTVNNGTADNNFNANAGQKTIYDPCPKGWRMAPAYAFANASNNTRGAFNQGGDFDIVTDGELWIPASGLRDGSDGTPYNVGTDGYNWSSSPNATSATRGSYLYFNSSSVNPANSYYRTGGYPGRCVQER